MRIAYCVTHPIQYQVPLIRHLLAGGVDLEVVYATDITAHGYRDTGFGAQVTWDVPLLEGYPYRVLFPKDPVPAGLKWFGRYRTALRVALDDIQPEIVWVHGWGNAYPLAALRVANCANLPVLMRGETYLDSPHRCTLLRMARQMLLSLVFRGVSRFLAVGSANREYYCSHGVPDERIDLVPYAVDNGFFQQRCRAAAPFREKLRQELDIEQGRPIILFCAKLIEVKDPTTLIRAVGKMNPEGKASTPLLLMVGEGELRPALEALAEQVAPGRVRFLGFRNQTELPAFYDLCDLFVLPSVFEPWGLVVNEVMNAGRPVIVSDKVGAGHDLVKPGINGDVFLAGNVDDLQARMSPWLEDAELRSRGGRESLRIINGWGFDQGLAGLNAAINALNLK